jgi:hypothetical protein
MNQEIVVQEDNFFNVGEVQRTRRATGKGLARHLFTCLARVHGRHLDQHVGRDHTEFSPDSVFS